MQFNVQCCFYECMTMQLTVEAADAADACQKAIEEANDRVDWRRIDWAGDTYVEEVSRAQYAESLFFPAEFADPMSPPVPRHTGRAWSDAGLAAMLDEPAAPAASGSPQVAICATCGSADIKADAWAIWDEVAGGWALESAYEGGTAYCGACEGDCSISFRAMTEGETTTC